MRDTIDMAREVYGAHTEWSGAPLDRLEQLVALVRADEREAAAPTVQEPVACVQDLDEVKRKHLVYEKGMDWKDPLYTTPPAAQRQWFGLTDEEVYPLANEHLHYQMEGYEVSGIYNLARAIEARLKELNT